MQATTAAAVYSGSASTLWAQEADGEAGGSFNSTEVLIWTIAFVGSLVALFFAYRFFKDMMAADEGNDRMIEIAGYVREGANAYLRQQYVVVSIFFVFFLTSD